jgi:hypothetical protein
MLRDDISILDLIKFTSTVHSIKPELRDWFCIGLECTKPQDANVIFHFTHKDKKDTQIVLISAEYIIEYLNV